METRSLFLVLATILGLLVLWNLLEIVLLVFAALIFAVLVRSISEMFAAKTKLSVGKSLMVVSLLTLVVIVGAIAAITPSIISQYQELSVEFPRAINDAQNALVEYSWTQPIFQALNDIDFSAVLNVSIVEQAFGIVSTALGSIATLFLIFFLGVVFAAEPNTYRNGFLLLVPKHKHARFIAILAEMKYTTRNWIIAKSISMLIIGILTTAGLLILDIPLAILLGLIAAILTLVPNIGPTLSAIPAVLLAFVKGPSVMMYVIILYVIVQLIETYLVAPLIEKKTLNMPPGLVLVAQLIFGIFFGLFGLILATPLLQIITILVKRLYIEDILKQKAK